MGQTEAVGDRLKSGRLGHDVDVGRDIRAMDDPGEPLQRRVGQVVLDDDRLKTAAPVHMPQFGPLDVEWDGPLSVRYRRNLLGRDKKELRIVIDEALDQPGTGNPVD